MHFVRGKFVGRNHALNATQASTASNTTGSMWRSGRTDGSDPVCNGINPSPPCTGLANIGNSGVVVCEQWRNGRWQTQADQIQPPGNARRRGIRESGSLSARARSAERPATVANP